MPLNTRANAAESSMTFLSDLAAAFALRLTSHAETRGADDFEADGSVPASRWINAASLRARFGRFLTAARVTRRSSLPDRPGARQLDNAAQARMIVLELQFAAV
jgi:hypothetical protein